MRKSAAWLLTLALAPLAVSAQRVAPARGAGQVRAEESSGGSGSVSPSVVATSFTHRDDNGRFAVDLLILWRGSPGWVYRRSAPGGSGSSSAGRAGVTTETIDQGGLHLTATYDKVSRSATILGDPVDLRGANVVFVDRVDSPDGPVIAGTLTVPPARMDPWLGLSHSLLVLLRDTPDLLAFLRCEAQLAEALNQVAMAPICTEAIFRGLATAPRTVTPVPIGPVTNRAAATGPPPYAVMPERPGQSSASAVVSPAVVAGWFASRSNVSTTLDLLVLWRGSPGWVVKGQGSEGSAGGSGSRQGMTITRDGRSLYAAFDSATRTAQIQDETLPLGDHNVVLVDDVDSSRGPRVVKTLRVDPAMADSRRIDAIIGQSSELAAYLRCDVKLPDARQQAVMDFICSRYSRR